MLVCAHCKKLFGNWPPIDEHLYNFVKDDLNLLRETFPNAKFTLCANCESPENVRKYKKLIADTLITDVMSYMKEPMENLCNFCSHLKETNYRRWMLRKYESSPCKIAKECMPNQIYRKSFKLSRKKLFAIWDEYVNLRYPSGMKDALINRFIKELKERYLF